MLAQKNKCPRQVSVLIDLLSLAKVTEQTPEKILRSQHRLVV
jgi:hypothetical protein